jgi:glycosyltransferase involved in cell wall biosynthesis
MISEKHSNMPSAISISVIIPLYNKEKYIEETIQSVLNQSFTSFELLIVDDGSTDNSVKIVEQIADNRIRVLRKPNGGVSDARNFGIRNAKTEWFFLLDADDILYPNCLEILLKLTIKYPNKSVYVANFYSTYSDGEKVLANTLTNEGVYSYNSKNIFFNRIFTRTGNTLLHKSVFENIGFYRTDMSFYEDMEHILRYADKYAFVYSPVIVFECRREFSNLSTDQRPPFEKEFAYTADFQRRTFFAKLIIGKIIFASFLYQNKHKHTKWTKYLIKKYVRYLPYIATAKIMHKLINLKIIK